MIMTLTNIYLLLAFLSVNIVHTYLLVSQKSERGLTISEHAAKTKNTHRFYLFSHMFAGVFFLLFAFEMFIIRNNTTALFCVSVVGALTEWIQAIIPASGRHERIHTAIAYLMSAIVTFIGILAAFLLPVDGLIKTLVLILGGLILCGYPLAVLLPKKYFWIIEMVNINLFFIQMILVSNEF